MAYIRHTRRAYLKARQAAAISRVAALRAQAPGATKTFHLTALVSLDIVTNQLLDLGIRVQSGLVIGLLGCGRRHWTQGRYAETAVCHVLGALAARALGRAETNLIANLIGTLAHYSVY